MQIKLYITVLSLFFFILHRGHRGVQNIIADFPEISSMFLKINLIDSRTFVFVMLGPSPKSKPKFFTIATKYKLPKVTTNRLFSLQDDAILTFTDN